MNDTYSSMIAQSLTEIARQLAQVNASLHAIIEIQKAQIPKVRP